MRRVCNQTFYGFTLDLELKGIPVESFKYLGTNNIDSGLVVEYEAVLKTDQVRKGTYRLKLLRQGDVVPDKMAYLESIQYGDEYYHVYGQWE